MRGAALRVAKSCGCQRSEAAKTHGLSGTRIYNAWQNMTRRCYDKKNTHYKHYGGRGITVCDRWRHSFENFLEDMGKTYDKKLELDRIDFNGNYELSNCRWATETEQANNSRRNIFLEYMGRKYSLSQWARIIGVSPSTFAEKMSNGWAVFKIFEFYEKKYNFTDKLTQIGSDPPEELCSTSNRPSNN